MWLQPLPIMPITKKKTITAINAKRMTIALKNDFIKLIFGCIQRIPLNTG
jgi:hypothetical protein